MLTNRFSNHHTIRYRKSSYRNKIEIHYMKRKSLISNYYYWKPLKNIVSIKITVTFFGNKYFLTIFAEKGIWVLNISVAKVWKFLWCIEIDLFKKMKKKAKFFVWRIYRNVDLPLYVILLLTVEIYSYKHTYILTKTKV